MRGFSAAELGAALGIGVEIVQRRELAGEVFSVARGQPAARQYPAFQTWPAIAQPLVDVLGALRGLSSTDKFGFFAAPTDLLGGLTPVEVLVGHLGHIRDVEGAGSLLTLAMDDRVEAVLQAAAALVALRSE